MKSSSSDLGERGPLLRYLDLKRLFVVSECLEHWR